jgi:hypothetical protein
MKAGRCGSWPFCNLPPAPGGRFCEAHQALLDNVKPGVNHAYQSRALPPSVTVSHAPAVAAQQKARRQKASAGYRSAILEALRDGPLRSFDLATACDTDAADRSYSRTRGELVAAGVIVEGERAGHERLYALAAAQ